MNPAPGAKPLHRALLRVVVAAGIVLVLHTVTRFSPWLPVGIGAVAVLLLLGQGDSVAGLRFMA